MLLFLSLQKVIQAELLSYKNSHYYFLKTKYSIIEMELFSSAGVLAICNSSDKQNLLQWD